MDMLRVGRGTPSSLLIGAALIESIKSTSAEAGSASTQISAAGRVVVRKIIWATPNLSLQERI
jgi:hypothetical protein